MDNGIKESIMQKLTSCLWFDDQAEDVAKLYVSIFKNSRLGPITRYGEAGAKASRRHILARETLIRSIVG